MTAPDDLSPRGAALWKALGQTLDTPAGALALEACRAVDRLDELDRIIAGKGVLNLMRFRLHMDDYDPPIATVKVEFSNVLSEVRQQQMALKQMLVTLGIDRKASEQGGESPLAQVLKLVADGAATPGNAAKSRRRPT